MGYITIATATLALVRLSSNLTLYTLINIPNQIMTEQSQRPKIDHILGVIQVFSIKDFTAVC
jgi:hypothetical protein